MFVLVCLFPLPRFIKGESFYDESLNQQKQQPASFTVKKVGEEKEFFLLL